VEEKENRSRRNQGSEFVMYRQCLLFRGSFQIAFIPEQFAKVGKYLRINDENGWKVVEVFKLRLSEDYLMEVEREYLHHRKVTDI
jgi:hypothetical protein